MTMSWENFVLDLASIPSPEPGKDEDTIGEIDAHDMWK